VQRRHADGYGQGHFPACRDFVGKTGFSAVAASAKSLLLQHVFDEFPGDGAGNIFAKAGKINPQNRKISAKCRWLFLKTHAPP
jgi:hypothetical protein